MMENNNVKVNKLGAFSTNGKMSSENFAVKESTMFLRKTF